MGILKHGALFIEYVCGSHILKFANISKVSVGLKYFLPL